GPNSSYPHHISSERKIQNNEPVLIDLGVKFKGYCSDLTRIFFLGKIKLLIKSFYNLVKEAQDIALRNIKPGVCISLIERKVRSFFKRKGMTNYLYHSLGHGIGLEVHEAPRINLKNTQELKEDMVFTVEPGLYRKRDFGIRIEDIVLVTKNGCEVLSGALDK
ncbi:MAG: M24 family metallopeptidase, partial [Candidatus Omnitrophica bacterium]|nr:M24 family metallopeptidase [Candidatus Omnitrophota bacterium]